MRSIRIGLAAVTLPLVAAAVSASQAAVPGIPAFYVDYNQNCTFSMSVEPGTALPPSSAPVTLPPGTYQVLISMQNFSAGYTCPKPVFTLAGPGVATRIEFAGVELHEEPLVTLQPSSTYVAQEESAPATTRRVLATAATGSSTSLLAPGTSQSGSSAGVAASDYVGSAILRYRGRLAATVSPAGKTTLRLNGRTVTSLKAGKYDVVVADDDPRAGLSVQHGGRRPLAVTGAAFTGTRTKRLGLAAGKWAFFATPGAGTVQITVTT